MSNHNFIVVSNRLPVTVSKNNGKLEFTPSPGGLATAMSSVESDDPMLWVGWPGINSEDLTPSDKRIITNKLREFGCAPVFLSAEQVEKFYEGYSNETLWPLFHYFQSTAQFNTEHWKTYRQVNALFNKAILKYADANATIWVHDYHFMLLPGTLRKSLKNASIGFFLHIPFPSFEIFRLLPQRQEILEGLLGADLVGFHIYDYVRHFTSSVLRALGHESQNGSIMLGDRIVKADAFPIGIDYKKFKKTVASKEVEAEIDTLTEHYKDQSIILSVDRLDYSKGILHRLEAFEAFLKQYPKHHRKVTMVVIAVPSRTAVDAYKELRDQVEQAVSRINGEFGDVDWAPISYQFQNQPFHKLLALYAHADVALVTPVRDGMNLVAKEYVACKQKTSGVLILSELAGAVDELPEALVVNPNDTTSIVEALETALRMPVRQKKMRITAMQRRLSSYDVQRWASDFLDQLNQTKELQHKRNQKLLNVEAKKSLTQEFAAAKKPLIVLDYDGTLKPFVNSAKANTAVPSRKLISLLSALTEKATVHIVSGRHREALDTWFAHLPLNLAAEHGYWVKRGNSWQSSNLDTSHFKGLVMPLLIKYTERTPGAVIEDKNSSIVWHYRNVPPELAYVRKQSLKHDLRDLLKDTGVSIHSGSKIIEIKPSSINKGTIVSDVLSTGSYDFVLCCGDDYTDEDMFKAMPDTDYAHSVKVGLGDTAARHQVASITDMLKLLKSLADSDKLPSSI